MKSKECISLKKYFDKWVKGHKEKHQLEAKALVKADEILEVRLKYIQADLLDHGKFIDRFWGVVFGITAFNAVITYVIMRIFGSH